MTKERIDLVCDILIILSVTTTAYILTPTILKELALVCGTFALAAHIKKFIDTFRN